jgi:hypothetical protein
MNLRLSILLLFIASVAYAQPCPEPPCPPDPGDPVPITGIEILLVGGAAIGVRKFYKRRSSNNNNVD